MKLNSSYGRDMSVRVPSDFRHLLLAALFAVGCGGADVVGNADMNGKADMSGGGTATFAEAQAKVFSTCGGEACHTRGPYAAGLNLTSGAAYASLVGVASTQAVGKIRVRPGDVNNSFLWQKLNNQEGANEGVGMPKSLTAGGWKPLSADLLQLVHDWIADGAKND